MMGFWLSGKSSIFDNMKVKKFKKKLPKGFKHDPELDKIAHVNWFPEKYARACEAMKGVKLPKL